MSRDDWKWMDEEDVKELEEEGKKAEGDFPCPRCTHWLPAGTTWCGWCGTILEEKGPRKKE